MNPVIIGNAKLYLGDGEEIAPELGFVDCMITDPPYDFNTSGGGKFRKSRKYMDDIAEAELDKGFNHQIINSLLYKSAFVFCHNDQLAELLTYLKGSYRRSCLLSWHKLNPMPVANKHYLPDTEFFIHAWNEGGHPVGDFHDKERFIIAGNGKSDFDHPTVKPLDVMDKIMKNANAESIIDPYMGTGSTGISALKLGKSFIGIEKNPKYFEIACKRISSFLTQ